LPTRATRIEYALIGIGQAKTAPETRKNSLIAESNFQLGARWFHPSDAFPLMV
jgi:hypothetical protein